MLEDWGTVLTSFEKQSFIRFFIIYQLIFTLLLTALGSLYYYKESNRLYQEQKTKNRLIFSECKRIQRLSSEKKDCKMPLIESIDGVDEVLKELGLVLSVLFILLMPIGYFLANLSIRPMKKSLESIDEFVNGIIHDLNTPLSLISINAQSIPLEVENKELVTEKSKRILQGIRDIESLEEQLMLSLKSDRYELSLESFNLEEILIERSISWKSLRNAVDISLDVEPLTITADKSLIIRMIDNLVGNAVKFSKRNTVVDITLKNGVLQIKDEGIGIKNPESIFEKYYKEDQKKKGLGLGLHIVKIVSSLHNIPLKVTSKIDKGSQFTIELSTLEKS